MYTSHARLVISYFQTSLHFSFGRLLMDYIFMYSCIICIYSFLELVYILFLI